MKQGNGNGLIVYQGVSQLDFKTPIVAILTGTKRPSENAKTGEMLQLFILVDDSSPIDASRKKQDSAICGQCPHRHSLGGACYVNIGQAPLAIWKAYKRGSYGVYSSDKVKAAKNKKIRLGAYGDPAALPFHVIQNLIDDILDNKGRAYWTGYTHQWRTCDQRLREYCQASVDSLDEALEAQVMGWKTFRVQSGELEVFSNEQECLADARGLSCAACTICRGLGNITIAAHGIHKDKIKAA